MCEIFPLLMCLTFLFVCLLLVIRPFLSCVFLIFICIFIDYTSAVIIQFFFLIGTYFRPNNSINYSASGLCYLNPSPSRAIVQPRKLLNDTRMISACVESYPRRGFQCCPKICIYSNYRYYPSFFAISDHHHVLCKYEATLRQSGV